MKQKIFNVFWLVIIVFSLTSCSKQLLHWNGINHQNLNTDFEKLKGGEWVENNNNGVYYFTEQGIKGKRVVLKSLDRDGVYVKLTPKRCLYKDSYNKNWVFIYYGKWIN